MRLCSESLLNSSMTTRSKRRKSVEPGTVDLLPINRNKR